MSEIVTASKWLYGVLNGDATLKTYTPNIYALPAPQGAALPYTVFNELSAVDLQTLGPQRIWTNALFIVRAVMETESYGGNLELAANRIDTLLQAQHGSVTGGNVWACVREQPFWLIDYHGGQQIRHLGGIYRIFAK